MVMGSTGGNVENDHQAQPVAQHDGIPSGRGIYLPRAANYLVPGSETLGRGCRGDVAPAHTALSAAGCPTLTCTGPASAQRLGKWPGDIRSCRRRRPGQPQLRVPQPDLADAPNSTRQLLSAASFVQLAAYIPNLQPGGRERGGSGHDTHIEWIGAVVGRSKAAAASWRPCCPDCPDRAEPLFTKTSRQVAAAAPLPISYRMHTMLSEAPGPPAPN